MPAALILSKVLPDLVVPHVIMDDHAGHIAVISRPRVLLRGIGAGRNFDVGCVMHRNALGLSRAVVQLGAGLHLLTFSAPRRHVFCGKHGIRDDFLLDGQSVFGSDDFISFKKYCHFLFPPFFLLSPSRGRQG